MPNNHMIISVIAAVASIANVHAEETPISGLPTDSAVEIIQESLDNYDVEAPQEVEVRVGTIGHSNGDFYYLHTQPYSSFEGPTLSLHLNSQQFTRDAEYFLKETKGYTAAGFIAEPTLKFRSREWEPVNIEAGAQILGIAGDDHRLHVNPIFRIEYQPTDWLRIIGGTIYGNLNHGLYEPMYDFDRYFYNNQEDGLQVMLVKEWKHIMVTSDTWLNWENFLEPGEFEQEKFTIGSSNRIIFGDENKKLFQIPIDILGTHRGGQFSAIEDTCLETIFNACTGLDLMIGDHVRTTALVFGYKNNSNEIWTPYKGGFGLYPIISYYNKSYMLSAGYWYGNKYIGTRGSYLFQNRSKYDEDFAVKHRNMITGKWYYVHGIFALEAQAYYDLKENKMDFSFGLYLKFNKDFKLLDRDI